MAPPILLTRQILDSARVEAFVQDEAAGAIVCFTGRTRKTHLGKTVLYLEYEAHEELALKTLAQLSADAAQRFDLVKTAIHHRLGRLEIGEASVVIAASSAHRAAAFEGCRYLIDTLKYTVPIWKKEYYDDGSVPEWIGPDGKPVPS